MSDSSAFAGALARALGPPYRVVLRDDKGVPLTSHGRIEDGLPLGGDVPLPRGGSIRIEISQRAIGAADRMLHDLAKPKVPAETLGAFSHLDDAIEHLIAQGEVHIGRPLAEMTRGDKQQLVRYLDEQGAFALRKAVESVAATLGVSRITVYNYLESARTG